MGLPDFVGPPGWPSLCWCPLCSCVLSGEGTSRTLYSQISRLKREGEDRDPLCFLCQLPDFPPGIQAGLSGPEENAASLAVASSRMVAGTPSRGRELEKARENSFLSSQQLAGSQPHPG